MGSRWPVRFDACEHTVASRDCGSAVDPLHQHDGHRGQPQRLLTGVKGTGPLSKTDRVILGTLPIINYPFGIQSVISRCGVHLVLEYFWSQSGILERDWAGSSGL